MTVADSSLAPPPGSADSVAHRRTLRLLRLVWRDRRLGWLLAVVVTALWAAIAVAWTPRGPLTTSEALWSILLSLLVGAVAGVVTHSRWSVLLAPVVFAVVFELLRIELTGLTVDSPRFSLYGLIALAVGRGFHFLLSLVPMALGASYGAAAARRWGAPRGSRRRLLIRRLLVGVVTIAMVALVVGLARPASTPAIEGPDGTPLAGSIAELTDVSVDGHELGLMLRGHDVGNAVVLFLSGGPGGAERGAMRNHLSALEEHFVVATWDQRGTGTSYDELDPVGSLTLRGAVDDTIAVTNYLRDRFDGEHIYLLGQSYGSFLGVLAVQQHPELYAGYIGTGQMVSAAETDRRFYEDTLAWARTEDNDGLVDKLESIGPPPYGDILDYETALSYEHDVYPYEHRRNSEGEGGFNENFLVPEHTLIDQVHMLAGFLDTFAVLYPQVQQLDFRESATRLEVPVWFVQGAHEAAGRADVFAEWYEQLDAPSKEVATLDTSGHRPLFEQPDEFVDYMVEEVLASTQ